LNAGTIKWKIPIGEDPDLAAKGVRNTGVPEGGERRGIVVTSTGLIFVNTRDSTIRAYDAANGKELWNAKLPTGTEGLPSLYEVQGREYLVVPAAAAEIGGRGTPIVSTKGMADRAYVVYALPK
jgi:quinoprotein glucose dehydrogenase